MKTLVALGRRPVLAWEALHAAWAFRSKGGILPSRALVLWRKAAAYGDSSHPMDEPDLISYLAWRRRFRSAVGAKS